MLNSTARANVLPPTVGKMPNLRDEATAGPDEGDCIMTRVSREDRVSGTPPVIPAPGPTGETGWHQATRGPERPLRLPSLAKVPMDPTRYRIVGLHKVGNMAKLRRLSGDGTEWSTG